MSIDLIKARNVLTIILNKEINNLDFEIDKHFYLTFIHLIIIVQNFLKIKKIV